MFNMNRLAGYLLRWTGDATYADYRERNLYNGILAAQHPTTGMVTYYLPLHSGGRKVWSTPTESFWCCVATLVQAHAAHADDVWYTDAQGDPVLAQYVGSSYTRDGVTITQTVESRPGDPGKADYAATRPVKRPNAEVYEIDVACADGARRVRAHAAAAVVAIGPGLRRDRRGTRAASPQSGEVPPYDASVEHESHPP